MEYSKEYKQLTQKSLPRDKSILDVISEGLPVDAIDTIASMLHIDTTSVQPLLGYSQRSIQQQKRSMGSNARLNEQSSDKILQLTRLVNELADYFGSVEAASHWMKLPNKGFGDKLPLDLCRTVTGMQMVRDTINRVKYGMTA